MDRDEQIENVVPVKAKTVIYEGSLVVIGADGYAIPEKKAENLLVSGRAQEFVSAGEADTTTNVRRGCFMWDNSGITNKDILKKAYIVDATTVTTTPTGSSVVGIIIAVEDGGVIV